MTDSDAIEPPSDPYAKTAYRSDALPRQNPLSDPGSFSKALEGLNFVERLPSGSYANLDIDVDPDSVAQGQGSNGQAINSVGPPWDHQSKPVNLLKTRWEIILMFAATFGDTFVFGFFAFSCLGTLILGSFAAGFWISFKYMSILFIIFLAVYLFFRHPFMWFLERHPEVAVRDLGCGYFRTTGKVKFRTYWGNETFEAPFMEFDPYMAYHVQPNGPVSYKLVLRHRYSGRHTEVANVPHGRKLELYAVWDQLQRYMDVSQPLPDIPALEAYRSLDPTTAQFDSAGKRERPSDYWASLDLDWWKREGFPEHMKKIAEFPWDTLEDKMEASVPNLREAAMV